MIIWLNGAFGAGRTAAKATQYQIEDVVLPDLQKLRETVLSGDIPADPGLRHLLAFCVPFKCWD